LFKEQERFKKSNIVNCIVLVFIHLVFVLWLESKMDSMSISTYKSLFQNWITVMFADRHYFDGSTAKSQALRGVLLRLFGRNEHTELIWKVIVLVSLTSLVLFWIKLRTKSLNFKVESYLLGVIAFVFLYA